MCDFLEDSFFETNNGRSGIGERDTVALVFFLNQQGMDQTENKIVKLDPMNIHLVLARQTKKILESHQISNFTIQAISILKNYVFDKTLKDTYDRKIEQSGSQLKKTFSNSEKPDELLIRLQLLTQRKQG